MNMPRFWTCLLIAGAISIPVVTETAWPNTRTTASSQSAAAAADITKTLEDYRTDLQTKRADLLAKNITLSATEAARFWPLYEKFQVEQNEILDAQLKGTQDYVANYEKLDDAKALSYLNVLLARDESMAALRRKYLPEFQKVVSTPTAVRVIQIDRRVSLLAQLELSSHLPLVR